MKRRICRSSPSILVEAVHQEVVGTDVSLLDRLEQEDVLVVDVKICVGCECDSLVCARRPFIDRRMYLFGTQIYVSAKQSTPVVYK